MGQRSLEYQRYLKSAAWKARAAAARKRAGGKCERCGYRGTLDAHHVTYERLGNERPEDLCVLCRGCHNLMHGLLRAPKPPRRIVKRKPPRQPASPPQRPRDAADVEADAMVRRMFARIDGRKRP